MLTMDQIHHIREMYYGQGYKISEIARKEKLDRRTVAKYIDREDFNRPAPKPASEYAFCPKLDPFKPVIDKWLTDDKKAPGNRDILQKESIGACAKRSRILIALIALLQST